MRETKSNRVPAIFGRSSTLHVNRFFDAGGAMKISEAMNQRGGDAVARRHNQDAAASSECPDISKCPTRNLGKRQRHGRLGGLFRVRRRHNLKHAQTAFSISGLIPAQPSAQFCSSAAARVIPETSTSARSNNTFNNRAPEAEYRVPPHRPAESPNRRSACSDTK